MPPSIGAARGGGCQDVRLLRRCVWITKSRYLRNVVIKQPVTGNLDLLTKNREVREKLLITLTKTVTIDELGATFPGFSDFSLSKI